MSAKDALIKFNNYVSPFFASTLIISLSAADS
jgi:hypothetical protein